MQLTRILPALLSLLTVVSGLAEEKPHAVIVVGTHHYSPHQTMPGFAAELERRGFRTTLINPEWDPEKDKRGLPGLEALADADVAVLYLRFLKLEENQLGHLTRYIESGKPLVSLRTTSHAFNYPKQHPRHDLTRNFGRDAIGTPYLIHLKGKTEIQLAENAADHPVLTGVASKWSSPGTLYLTDLHPDAKPLLVGTGRSKPGTRKNAFGTHELKAQMTDTVAWTWENQWKGRVFATSLGHAGDFEMPQSMRLIVNGVFWAAGLDIPPDKPAIRAASEKPARPKKPVSGTKPSSKGLPDVPLEPDGLTVFYGNSFVERQQEDGTLEALLQAANPGKKLRFRSLAYSADEVSFRIRPSKFGAHLGYISRQFPCERVVMCFGMNESFAGAGGLAKFRKDLDLYLSIIRDRHPGSELVLVSPIAVEPRSSGIFPDADRRNSDIALYCQAMQKAAEEQGATYVDLFTPSGKLYQQSEQALTSNGIHLNQAGNRAIARVLAGALSSPEDIAIVQTDTDGFDSLRRLASRKAYEVAMAYHPANGIHYYGTRSRPFEYETEIPHHLNLATQLDEAIWEQAGDLATTVPQPELPTTNAEPPPKDPRKGLGIIQSSEDDLAGFTVADGFSVNLFASSEDFPELINPLQIRFDSRGRLWVVTFESYPVPIPGTLSNDKVLILEDTDGDGRADKRTVFADGLKLPDGFVFYKDGIIVSVARQFLWLRDTDGNDIADLREEVLRGGDDTDTHHGGYLARTTRGQLIINEALFHRGRFETPHGVVRTKDASVLFYDLDSQQLSIERQTTHPNPWKISFNESGESFQMFGGGQIIDCDYYNIATPPGTAAFRSMGMPFRYDKGCTLEVVSGTHFPQEWQGGLLTGHLLAQNCVLFTPLKLKEGTWVAADKAVSLLSSNNKVFRPTDLTFGLDGALYISDFYYPIIGHAQHSIRDANRDYENGRIWRVSRKDAPLATPPVIEGASIASLFPLLTHPQIQVRELAREELERRPTEAVLTHAKSVIANGVADEFLGLELLWLFERTKDFSQPALFRKLLDSESLPIQRAAARSLRWWAPSLGEEARERATRLMQSQDERTRIAVISAASHLRQLDPFWTELIDQAQADDGSPLGNVIRLAQLHTRRPIQAEFPILTVSSNTKLGGWLPNTSGEGRSLFIKSDDKKDLVLSYSGDPMLNITFNGIPVRHANGSVHAKSGQLNLDFQPGLNVIEISSADGGGRHRGKATLNLANSVGKKPKGIRFAANHAEHQDWANAYNEKFATVTDKHIYLKTIPAALMFNVKSFTVKAGKRYDFIFENSDHMLHNVVITKIGAEAEIGALADNMASQPDAMAAHYVPESDLILFSTPQIPYGETFTKPFIAPTQPGEYPFLCTFPGHWRLMRGLMIVK